jgi:serine protease Do
VLTSLHVVDSEDRLEAIAADGASYAVHVARREPRFDLGLLAFDRPPTGLRGLDLSEMGGDTEVGTWVFATGNPFFLALDGHAAVSLGMVSGVRPAAATNYIKGPILQHDAEINPGSSGGPLWSTTGRLLGINGTIATRSRAQGAGPVYTGASFAVPIEDVRRFVATGVPGGTSTPVAPAVVARGPVPPPVVRSVPFLGIRTRTQVGRSGSPSGARVTGVIAPSPVAPTPASAGIRPGDVITRFSASGRAWTIRSADDVERAVARSAPGSLVSLRFVRGGRVLGWTGRLAEIR